MYMIIQFCINQQPTTGTTATTPSSSTSNKNRRWTWTTRRMKITKKKNPNYFACILALLRLDRFAGNVALVVRHCPGHLSYFRIIWIAFAMLFSNNFLGMEFRANAGPRKIVSSTRNKTKTIQSQRRSTTKYYYLLLRWIQSDMRRHARYARSMRCKWSDK